MQQQGQTEQEVTQLLALLLETFEELQRQCSHGQDARGKQSMIQGEIKSLKHQLALKKHTAPTATSGAVPTEMGVDGKGHQALAVSQAQAHMLEVKLWASQQRADALAEELREGR